MFSVIVLRNKYYYCGFSVEQGSLWNLHEDGAFWMEDHQIDSHYNVLLKVEGIDQTELEIRKINHASIRHQ